MRNSIAFALSFALIVAASPALAQKKRGPGKPTPAQTSENCKEFAGDQLEACKAVGTYLDLWKLQKWPEVKKLIHPKTIEEIATVNKNLGRERHRMAPWFWAKEDFLLTNWKVASIEDFALGTVVIHTTEQSYRVEEDGFAEDEPNAYLAGKIGGRWMVVDRRSGGGGFDARSIRTMMKDHLDPAPEAKEPEAAQAKEAPAAP